MESEDQVKRPLRIFQHPIGSFDGEESLCHHVVTLWGKGKEVSLHDENSRARRKPLRNPRSGGWPGLQVAPRERRDRVQMRKEVYPQEVGAHRLRVHLRVRSGPYG